MNASSTLQGWFIRLAIAVLFLVAAIIAGCGSGVGTGGTGGFTVAQSSLGRDTNPQVSDAELAAVVAGNTAFALKVFPLLDTAPASNTFFSPYSITQAFALLAPGAEGLKSVEFANAALYSTWTNQTVTLPLDGAKYEAALLEKIAASTYEKRVVTTGVASDFAQSFTR